MQQQHPMLNIAIKAARRAGSIITRAALDLETVRVSTKGPGDFVTEVDEAVEKDIVDTLLYSYPEHGILAEESGLIGNENSAYRWIIDPLDGTTNFLHGIPHWAISIALETKGEIVAGVIYDPIKDELFTAEKNGGAFMRRRRRMRVSGRHDLMQATIATGSPRRAQHSRDKFMKEYQAVMNVAPGLRRFGAAALDLAYVAAGRYEGFWERELNIWDIAAGILIVRESGGFVHDLDLDKNDPVVTGNVVAGNDKIFTDLKKVLRAV